MSKKCKKSNINCGTVISSHCVDYTGEDLTSLDKGVDQCDLSVSEVIENFDIELKKVKDGLDTKKLVRLCISSIDKEDTPIIIINKLISEICSLNKDLKEVKSKYEELDILASSVNIDSDCLSNVYCASDGTLKSLLTKMIGEICQLKSQVNGTIGSSSNIYQP